MHFPQRYHNRPQGRPNEKEFELFSNTKISFKKVGNETEDKKNRVWFPWLSYFLGRPSYLFKVQTP